MKKYPNEVLREYLYLNPWNGPKLHKTLKDKMISCGALWREYGSTGTMYIIETPQTITVPIGYIDLWRILDVGVGEQLLYTEIQGLGKLDLFIVGLEKFTKLIDTSTELDGLELFLLLSRIGTGEIREFLEDLGISLGPWIYDDLGKTLEL